MDPRADRWKADCGRCAGLCCSVFSHAVDNGFPDAKPANVPCRHLTPGFRCAVFATLERNGYTICRAYDCWGAGPVATARMRAAGVALGPSVSQDMTPYLEDFRRLARLHLLIRSAELVDDPDASALRRALVEVSLAYEAGEVPDIDAAVTAAVRPYRRLVGEIVAGMTNGRGGTG